MSSLTSKVITGSKWMILLRLVNRASSTVVSIILARILALEAFGLVAVGILAVSFLQVFSEVGIKQALIKENESDTEKMLDTAWTVEFFRGLLIFTLVFFSADLIAQFFEKPETINIIRFLGLLPFIKSISSIKIIYLQKELEFKKQFIYELSGIAGPLLIAIPLALILKNVWAIVFGTLASELIKMIVSYIVTPYKPKFAFNKSHFFQMFNFGKWILFGSIVSFFAMEMDTFVAAKVFDVRLLGIYTLAFTISNKPIVEIGKALGKVLFPAFAKIGYDKKRTKKAFLKSSYILYLIVIPAPLGIHLVAEDIVSVLLGHKWLEIIPALRILALGVIFRVLTIPSSGLFYGIGKPNLVFILSSLRIAILIIAIFTIKSNINLVSISYAVLISNLGVFISFIYLLVKHSNIKPFEFLINNLTILIPLSFMLLFVSFINYKMDTGFLRLCISILGSLFLYSAIVYQFSKTKKHNYISEYIKLIIKK